MNDYTFIEGYPTEMYLTLRDPLADEGCFAESSGGRDEGHLAVEPRVQFLNQVWAGYQIWSRRRDKEFC